MDVGWACKCMSKCAILNMLLYSVEEPTFMKDDLDALEQERTRLFGELAQIGDLRRGSIAENYRRCGKPSCCCAREEHRGHGPQYLLMTKVDGRSRAKNLRPGPELAKVRAEVSNHLRFRELVQRIVQTSEEICDRRPVVTFEEDSDRTALKKTSRRSFKKRSRAK